MGQDALRKSISKGDRERENDEQIVQLAIAEKQVQYQLPIYNQVKSLMPPRSDFMKKNPLPKSSNANISTPEVANFFKLHPIPLKKEG